MEGEGIDAFYEIAWWVQVACGHALVAGGVLGRYTSIRKPVLLPVLQVLALIVAATGVAIIHSFGSLLLQVYYSEIRLVGADPWQSPSWYWLGFVTLASQVLWFPAARRSVVVMAGLGGLVAVDFWVGLLRNW